MAEVLLVVGKNYQQLQVWYNMDDLALCPVSPNVSAWRAEA